MRIIRDISLKVSYLTLPNNGKKKRKCNNWPGLLHFSPLSKVILNLNNPHAFGSTNNTDVCFHLVLRIQIKQKLLIKIMRFDACGLDRLVLTRTTVNYTSWE
jgi:hypothetical protein